MTPTGQDGDGLISEKTLDDLLVGYYGGWNWVEEVGADELASPIRERFRAALAAVAPDIAAQIRRECAEEVSRYAAAIGRSNVYDDPQLAQIERALNGIAAEWSGSGRTPAGGERAQ